MSIPLIIAVIFIGLLLVVLEIVALPGAVAGICGGIFVAVGIWQAYEVLGPTWGTITLFASIVVGIALLAFFMKSKTWRRASLHETVDSKTNVVPVTVGDMGHTLSRLAPAGKALINGHVVEVHTISEYLEPESSVRVIAIEGYKVTVEKY